MDAILTGLGAGLCDRARPAQPLPGAGRLLRRNADRRAAGHRPDQRRRHPAADRLRLRPAAGIGHHPARRHLLRRRVWRAHLVDPAQRAGRRGRGDDHARRQSDGQERRSGPRPLPLRHRLLRGRYVRGRPDVAVRAAAGVLRGHLLAVGLCGADGVRVRLAGLAGRRQPGEDAAGRRTRADAGLRRHRRQHRRGALHLRHPGHSRRDRLPRRRHRPLRHGRADHPGGAPGVRDAESAEDRQELRQHEGPRPRQVDHPAVVLHRLLHRHPAGDGGFGRLGRRLRHREARRQGQRGRSARATSAASRRRRRPTTRRPAGRWCRC